MTPSEFDAVRSGFHESRAEAAIKQLTRRGFDARYFAGAEQAVEAVLQLIPPGSAVGAGGSVTLRETGVLERLAARGDRTVYHTSDMAPEESMQVRREAVACPYFLASSNAVTLEGELVNTDGIGNRLTGMMFGPRTVIIIAGVNKLVADRAEAFNRIRNVAAPANARRLGIDAPCVKAGRCVDCRSDYNICRITAIMSGRPMWTDVKIFLVGETLGL